MKMRKKQVLYGLIAVILLLPSFLVKADSIKEVEAKNVEGNFTSKDEVVYATLDPSGDIEEVYVVNTLDVAESGEIVDFGEYHSVKNLTDLSELILEDQGVRMTAPEGKFYYQGNMKADTKLPWNITVSYLLDGEKINPTELAGKMGHVEIKIQSSANKNVDGVFYENYILQISLQLPNKYENINAFDGMVANAGKNKQITYTVMPGEEVVHRVTADVVDFEFEGIEIAAVPSSLPIDISEMDNMTDDMASLSDAIHELNNGVADLKDGASQLNSGAETLRDGSAQYKDGINQMSSASSELVHASSTIQEALEVINQSLSGSSSSMDLSKLNDLPAGLTALSAGLTETANGLSTLQKSYAQAFSALDEAINGIPTGHLTEEQISSLYQSGANSTVLDQLLASYSAAQKVKATYSAVKEGLAAVEPSLNQASEAINGMSGQLNQISLELSESLKGQDLSSLGELQKGIAGLATNYKEFHAGLVGYTSGVNELSSSYGKLHSGIVELSGGTQELSVGIGELHDGTNELNNETRNLPEQMQAEINSMIQEYDKSDFEPVSFVSPKNEKVYSVQFVMKTESIKKEEQEAEPVKPKEEKGFWTLLLDLFKK